MPADLEPSFYVFTSAFLAHETFSVWHLSQLRWLIVRTEWWNPLTQTVWDVTGQYELQLFVNYIFHVSILVAIVSSLLYGHGDLFGSHFIFNSSCVTY